MGASGSWLAVFNVRSASLSWLPRKSNAADSGLGALVYGRPVAACSSFGVASTALLGLDADEKPASGAACSHAFASCLFVCLFVCLLVCLMG
jgi:hypothetical protein